MKYTYAYKTSDGTRHEASIDAPSREVVFETLRKRGIKAIKVVAADGSKANGEIRGVRKRVVAFVALGAAILAGTVVLFTRPDAQQPEAAGVQVVARPLPRQEIAGNRARIDAAAALFTDKAEAFLARFVEPGRPFVAPECDWPSKAEFAAILDKPVTYAEDELTEQIDFKRMLVYLKREMAFYLTHGGYVSGYIRDLIKRQDMEIAEREKHQKKLNELLGKSDKDAYNYWLKANAQLRVMGIYSIPLPDTLLHYSLNSSVE